MTEPTASSGVLGERQKRIAAMLLALVAVAAMGYWLYQRLTHVYTDDARIAADMIDVATEVSGRLQEFNIKSGQMVTAGQVLARIDDRQIRHELTAADARRDANQARFGAVQAEQRMVAQQISGGLDAARSRLDAAQALERSAQSELDLKQSEWSRAQSLRKRDLLSEQEWQQAQVSWRQAEQGAQRAQAAVAEARAALVEAEALQIRLDVIDRELAQLRAQQKQLDADRERLAVLLDEHVLVAPSNGVVDETFVNPGEHLSIGQRLLLMHDPGKLWVDANVKETEIRHLKVGQPVQLSVDAFPGRDYNGWVKRIGNAATSEFSLLPSTNPSGNFTKITQRLPLKIELDANQEGLRPGMMVEVAVDVRGD